MRIRRRSLRKGLIVVGCLVGSLGAPTAGAGMSLILVGCALHLWSKGCLEQNRRLTTAGPYRFTRNPFYLANLAIDLGLCLVIGQPVVFVVYGIVWWVSYRDTIDCEEQKLAELFPIEFKAYAASVPRLFPSPQPLPMSAVVGQFSWRNPGLAQGAEYARLVGIALSVLALWASERVRELGFDLLDGNHDLALTAVVCLPAGWVLKLALAETFRRPRTRLVPALSSHRSRLVMVVLLIGCLGMGIALSVRSFWLVAPGLWLGVLGLDLYGAIRAVRSAGAASEDAEWPVEGSWRYFAPAFAGTIVFAVALQLGVE